MVNDKFPLGILYKNYVAVLVRVRRTCTAFNAIITRVIKGKYDLRFRKHTYPRVCTYAVTQKIIICITVCIIYIMVISAVTSKFIFDWRRLHFILLFSIGTKNVLITCHSLTRYFIDENRGVAFAPCAPSPLDHDADRYSYCIVIN